MQLTQKAQNHIAKALREGDAAIDGTAGNGYDTAFLAKKVTASGKVFAFDVQPEAISATQLRLEKEQSAGVVLVPQTELILASHDSLLERIPKEYHGRIRAAMFNLGYLPGSDKTLVTRSQSTLAALEQLLGGLLADAAIVTVIAYTGHPGGMEEYLNISEFIRTLPTNRYLIEQDPEACTRLNPILFVIRKGRFTDSKA